MDKTKMKKVETFASIFGEDHSEVPSEKTDGTTSLKLNDLIPFRNHPFKLYEGVGIVNVKRQAFVFRGVGALLLFE